MRLKSDVRHYVRGLGQHAVFTPEWFKVCELVNQLARVAENETAWQESDELRNQRQGRKEDGTLWDQAQDESAVRTLLEEGKLNLCLRLLLEYKDEQMKSKFDSRLKDAAKKHDVGIENATKCCEKLERGIGFLLHVALHHVEAMQIVDIPLLVNHCRVVLQEMLTDGDAATQPILESSQKARVFSYLYWVIVHADQIDEDRMVELLQDAEALFLAVMVAKRDHKYLPTMSLKHLGVFLSKLMETEIFQTDSKKIINSLELKAACVELKDSIFKRFSSEDTSFKRNTRQLMRSLEMWEFELEESNDEK